MIKWQLLPLEDMIGDIHIKHQRLLKLFGARLHPRPEKMLYEYRLAYFTIVHSPKPMQERKRILIPIPFMKDDHGIMWH